MLFETGAIVLHSGEPSEALLPEDPAARARAMPWVIAALNSVEPFVLNVALIDLFYANEEWARLRRPGAVEFAKKRISGLSTSLGDKPYLDGDAVHGRRPDDVDGAADPALHRHRDERRASRPISSAAPPGPRSSALWRRSWGISATLRDVRLIRPDIFASRLFHCHHLRPGSDAARSRGNIILSAADTMAAIPVHMKGYFLAETLNPPSPTGKAGAATAWWGQEISTAQARLYVDTKDALEALRPSH